MGSNRRERDLSSNSRRACFGKACRASPAFSIVTDERAIILDGTPRAASFFNVRREALKNRPLLHFVARRDTRAFRSFIRQLTDRGGPIVVELRPRHGKPCPMILTSERVRGARPYIFVWKGWSMRGPNPHASAVLPRRSNLPTSPHFLLRLTGMRVLAALDSTPRAQRVLESAVEVAECLEATVVPFRAVQVPPEFPAAAAFTPHDELPEFLVRQGHCDLKRMMAATSSRRLTEPVVRIGQPWRSIVEAADAIAAELIVVGSHGYHGLDLVLGTNARRVTDAARQDVLVIHDGTRSTCSGSVTIALDGSGHDAVVLETGLKFAAALKRPVHLIRVVRPSPARWAPQRAIMADMELRGVPSAGEVPQGAEREYPWAVHHPYPRRPDQCWQVTLSVGRPWQAILAAARTLQTGLVVVGSGSHRLGESLIRTTAAHIVDHARESVLIVNRGCSSSVA